MAWCKVPTRNLSSRTEENYQKHQATSLYPSQDLDLVPPNTSTEHYSFSQLAAESMKLDYQTTIKMYTLHVEHPPQNSTSSATKVHHILSVEALSWHRQLPVICRNVLLLSSLDGYLNWDVVAVYTVPNWYLPKHGRAYSHEMCVFCITPAVQYTWFHSSISDY
jgi:hypothetical protein